jgi:hypothetical protein
MIRYKNMAELRSWPMRRLFTRRFVLHHEKNGEPGRFAVQAAEKVFPTACNAICDFIGNSPARRKTPAGLQGTKFLRFFSALRQSRHYRA